MTNDVEMNDVKAPLMNSEDTKESNGGMIPDVDIKSPNEIAEFTGLTKEELEKFAKDPFWRKLRLILFILFWFLWLAMLIGAILIVVLSPKCPKTPKLNFWEKKTGYWVDTMGFVDTNNDNIGDFKGLISRLDYIQKELGAGYIILDQIFDGQFSNKQETFGSVKSFREIDNVLGGMESFKSLIKEGNKRGIEIVLAADFNSLSESSSFLQSNLNTTLDFDKTMDSWVSRDGKSSRRFINGQPKYSSLPESTKMFDLNLKNELVLNEIKDSVKMWLQIGVRGFLLTNVAFYVENVTVPSQNYSMNNISQWYSRPSLKGQIYAEETKVFLREVRSVIDEVAKKTDKKRVLIVEAGNVGFGLGSFSKSDHMLQYLEGPDKIVDMVVSREFLRDRGWNILQGNNSKSKVKTYLKMTPENLYSRMALTSATSTSLRTTNLKKIAAPFLLPGNSILYYGSEIGNECNITKIKSITSVFYPKNIRFPLDEVTEELPTKCNHMVMPWDHTGMGFSNNNGSSQDGYIKSDVNTVQSLTAVGRDETILQLHQKLIKIRKEPSIQWGRIKMFHNEQTSSSSYEIFVREADGFPKMIIALIEDNIDGRVFSFSSECAKVKPILVYPSNSKLPENTEVDANNIYLKIHRKESVHVFKCVT